MRNSEVINAFLQHEPAGMSSLWSDGDILYSYAVPIAKWVGPRRVVIPDAEVKYSRTTSRHRNAVMDLLRARGISVSTVQ